jgi:hypothetical protein
MNKTAAALMGGIVLVAAATGLLLSRVRGRPAAGVTGATASVGAGASGTSSSGAARSPGPSAEETISRLVLARSPAARLELVSLYVAWAKDPARNNDRRRLIEKVASNEEPMVAINLLATAAAGDPTPLEADALLPDMARALAPLWRDEKMFAEGRDLLRLAEHDKSKALLAATLTLRAERPPGGLQPLAAGERHELASDLIQINMHTANRALKAQTLTNVRTVAGPAVAEVLADPANAATSLAARNADKANAAARQLMRSGAP